jgi:hypothetical protein
MDPRLERLLRLLWEEWDPIDLNSNPNLADEYDHYAFELWDQLRNGASVDVAERYLADFTDSMGLSLSPDRNGPVAAKAFGVVNSSKGGDPASVAIRLTKGELEVLSRAVAASPTLGPELGRIAPHRMVALIEVEAARDLREQLLEELDVAGFDKDYALTPKGQSLLGLSDKLFSALEEFDDDEPTA